MKKLVYIFSLLLLACACNLEDFEPQTSRDADKVRLSLSLSVPEVQSLTRAMDDKPQLETLHLVVFDQNGMLVEYAQAQNLEKATENDKLYTFDVELTISDTPRHIHFVGNSPAAPKFGMETDVMTAMETESGADAYWYRKTIAKIDATTDAEGKLIPTQETKAAFGVIPLVRNFAKIVVTESADNFELVSYAIAGRPVKGKVAPYNRNKGNFQDFVKTDGLMKTYEELTADGYDAFSPTGVGLDFRLEDSDSYTDFSADPKYVYERETPLSNASYVIVKGYYNGDKNNTVYYKVNLRDKDGNYVPLRRNFQYNINISSVTRNGYATVADAVASSGSGDISTDLEFISLTNISDGEVRLTVEYTSKTLVSSDPVTLKVKFDKVGSNPTLGKLTAEKGPEGETGAAINSVSAAVGPDSKGWYTYTITPVAVSGTQKTQSLIVTGNYTLGGKSLSISREVSYTLMEKRVMSAQCIPSEVLKEQGQEFDLQITIPDGLGESMFPLEFSIEAVELSITPKNDNMPVESGKSTIPGSTKKSSFWFVKTLSYEEYKAISLNEDQTKSFLCHFATNKAISATAIYVSNPYFNQTSCKLGNYVPLKFDKLKYDNSVYPEEEGTPVTFTFTTSALPSQGNITVTLTGLVPADDEDKLSYAGEDANGNPMYTLAANATSYTLKLVAADATTEFNVKLEAYHFVTEQASAKRARIMHNFVNPVFPEQVNWTTGKTAKFTFSYHSADLIEPVTMTLTNIKPKDGDTRFKLITGTTYTFTPVADSGVYQEINFLTTSDHGSVGVKMESAHHNSATAIREKRYYEFTATLDLKNAEQNWGNQSAITATNGSTVDKNERKITVAGEYKDTEIITFSYTVTGNYVSRTYTASATIKDLSDGSATLTFQRQ